MYKFQHTEVWKQFVFPKGFLTLLSTFAPAVALLTPEPAVVVPLVTAQAIAWGEAGRDVPLDVHILYVHTTCNFISGDGLVVQTNTRGDLQSGHLSHRAFPVLRALYRPQAYSVSVLSKVHCVHMVSTQEEPTEFEGLRTYASCTVFDPVLFPHAQKLCRSADTLAMLMSEAIMVARVENFILRDEYCQLVVDEGIV